VIALEGTKMSSQKKRARRILEPKQLSLSMETVDCPHYKDCDAPLCPRDVNFGKRIWFPCEPVCRLRIVPDWVQKQRRIARLPGIDAGRYFTFRMLNVITRVGRGLQGANPDHVTAERIWFAGWVGKKGRGKAKTVARGPEVEQINPPLF